MKDGMGKSHTMKEKLNAYRILMGKPDGMGHWTYLNVGWRVI
jgi:hypothetical protein